MPEAPPAKESAPPALPIGKLITAAVGLGRHMTQLYVAVAQRTPAAAAATPDPDPAAVQPTASPTTPLPPPPPTAPTTPTPTPTTTTTTQEPPPPTTALGPLDGDQQFHLRLLMVEAALFRLRPVAADSGIPLVATDDLLAEEQRLWGPAGCQAVTNLHSHILQALTAAMPSMGMAYELGSAFEALCETGQPPIELARAFEQGRVDHIRDLLDRLGSVLPDHSARAVTGGLNNWDDWLRAGMIGTQAIRWDRDGPVIAQALAAQGTVWLSLLDGQKDAIDLLSADDYVDAGEALLGQYRKLGQRFVAQWWPSLLIGLVVAAGIVGLLYTFGHGDTKGIGTIATVLAGLGITAKAATSTLEKTASNLEAALWQAELDKAIGYAATSLPGGMTPAVTPTNRPLPRTQHRAAQSAQQARNQAIAARAHHR